MNALKIIGLVLALVLPGGFLFMAFFVWVAPKILRIMMNRLEKEMKP